MKLIGITIFLTVCLLGSFVYTLREEIVANWSKYKSDPFYMFFAYFFKPEDDPRSRIAYAMDTFQDNLYEVLNQLFAIFLQPVFKIFKLFSDALVQSLSGLFNIRAILGNMWRQFNKMTDIFTRRYNDTFHRLRVTFVKLNQSMQRTFGIATSAIYAGLSTIHTMTSFLDLMIKIIIAILVILVAMVILLFFVLAPAIPLILTVVGIVGATAFGGAVGGMAGAFCFSPTTRIVLHTGETKQIAELHIGDILLGNQTVDGIIVLNNDIYQLYDLYGVHVSGDHIVYYKDQPIHVKDHPHATFIENTPYIPLYCVLTSNHRVPVQTTNGVSIFADWEEIESPADLTNWYKTVFEILNPGCTILEPHASSMESESAFSKHFQVATKDGKISISKVVPGMYILDKDGQYTKVLGVVVLDGSIVKYGTVGHDGESMGAGVWAWDNNKYHWFQTSGTDTIRESYMYSVFTDSGTFLVNDMCVRDFSDVGISKISETYPQVLEALQKSENICVE